jgi:hypothetical protein
MTDRVDAQPFIASLAGYAPAWARKLAPQKKAGAMRALIGWLAVTEVRWDDNWKASEPRERAPRTERAGSLPRRSSKSEGGKRRARERAGESEGRSPSDEWRRGRESFQRVSRNPNECGFFHWNSRRANDLASSNSFVGLPLFASVFWFCQRNDTRNDTRRGRLPESSPRTGMSERARSLYRASFRTSIDTNSGRILGKHSFPLSSTIFQAA